MRKTLLFTCVLVLCTISSCSHKLKISKVPEKVKSSFYQKFPDAKDVNWEKKNDMYEVEIEMGKKEAVVLFSADGTYIAQQFDVDKNDVPSLALNYIKTKYNNPRIKEAEKLVMADGSLRFIIEIKKKEIHFDASGNFLKEEKD